MTTEYFDYDDSEPEPDDKRPLTEYVPPVEDLREQFWDKDENGNY